MRELWWKIAARQDPALDQEAAAAQARLATAEPRATAGNQSLADFWSRFVHGEGKGAVADRSNVPMFVELAGERGLAFTFDNGRSDQRQLPETMSGGVGLLDFDGDGWLDIYAIQGGKFPPPPAPAVFRDRLFRNRGDGRFDDVTVASGLAKLPGGYGHGVAVGDYDNDGRPDLLSRGTGGPTPFITTPAKATLKTPPPPPDWGAIVIGPLPPHGPTLTTTATSTSMSAIISNGTNSTPGFANTRASLRKATTTATPARSPRYRTISFVTTAEGLST